MYIDPGSGSMTFQLIMAGVLGYCLVNWRRFQAFIRRLFGGNQDSSS